MNRAQRRAAGHRREELPRPCDTIGVLAIPDADEDGGYMFSIGVGDQGEVPIAAVGMTSDELLEFALTIDQLIELVIAKSAPVGG